MGLEQEVFEDAAVEASENRISNERKCVRGPAWYDELFGELDPVADDDEVGLKEK